MHLALPVNPVPLGGLRFSPSSSKRSMELSKQLGQACIDLLEARARIFFGPHDHIDPQSQTVLLEAKGFTDQSFPTIASGSVPYFLRDRQAQPDRILAVGPNDAMDDQHFVGNNPPQAKDSIKVIASHQSLAFGKSKSDFVWAQFDNQSSKCCVTNASSVSHE